MTNITHHTEKNSKVKTGTNPAIQVHLVALPLMAWGLERMVQGAAPGMEVASSSESVTECLSKLQHAASQVVVVDLDSEENLNSLTTLSSRTPARILVVSGALDADLHDRAILAGARGVVNKRESPAALLKAIERVHEGEIWLDRDATSRIFMQLVKNKTAQPNDPAQDKIASLTRREREAVAALVSDASAPGKVIADRLNMSEHTLRNHLTSIYSKLDLVNRVDLYAFAHKYGLSSTS